MRAHQELGGDFAAFSQWAAQYAAEHDTHLHDPPDPVTRAAGQRLALKRRADLADLIETNPEQALALALPDRLRELLPPPITDLLETRIHARAPLDVLGWVGSPEHPGAGVIRFTEIDGITYRAFTYGHRSSLPTLPDTRIDGIAIDDALAVRDLHIQPISPDLIALAPPPPDTRCASCETSIAHAQTDSITGLLVDETSFYFCCPAHADAIDPTASPIAYRLASTNPSTYTLGLKTVLLIRVDFNDLPGEPFSLTQGRTLLTNLHQFYSQGSYQRTDIALPDQGSDVTPVLRLLRTASFYGTNSPNRLRTDARNAAQAAGYTLGDYNFDVVCFGNVRGFDWAGLGFIGQPGAWIRNTSSLSVTAHELGHNFGLNHANFWDTSGQSIIGPGAASEYGDTLDTMGSSGGLSRPFNGRYKTLLQWIRTNEMTTVRASGVFRLVPIDTNAPPDGLRALAVPRGTTGTNYWIEYRRHTSGNRWLPHGVTLRWGRSGNQSTLLLDTTPGTPDDRNDSPLIVGHTFSDRPSGVHITPLRVAESSDDGIDVAIELGSFPNNRPPSVAIQTETLAISPGQFLTLAAQTADPDQDPVVYSWDFGDVSQPTNAALVQHRWTATGDYLVRCTVSDLRGGTASDSLVVRVGTPSTFRIAGHVLADGSPLPDVLISANSSYVTRTDTQGRYFLVGLPAGSYSLKAAADGFVFIHPGFENPVQLGPSKDPLDFSAIPPAGRTLETLVTTGSAWRYLDDGSNPGSAWRQPHFDDSLWDAGSAPLGYGDDGERTQIQYGPDPDNKHVTTYFRHRFPVPDPTRFLALTLGLRRDDGAIVYLNGSEVFRSNMPSGGVSSTTLASATVGGSDETTFFETDFNPALLLAGDNTLAVEVHQRSRDSSDLAFDLRLTGASVAGFPSTPLAILRAADGGIALSWSDTGTNWILQATASLVPPVPWQTLSLPGNLSNGERTVTLPSQSAQRFYRLLHR